MAGALLEADGTARTFIQIDLVAFALAQLDDGPLRAGAEAAVAFKAISAGQAALGLEYRILFFEAFDDFLKPCFAATDVQMALRALRRVGEVPDMELVKVGQLVFG